LIKEGKKIIKIRDTEDDNNEYVIVERPVETKEEEYQE
jgi:hypothetical protein